jgi:hypothetical protein
LILGWNQIFATNATLLVDLLAHWNLTFRPLRNLIFLLIEIVFGFALGLVPGVDNFSHLGQLIFLYLPDLILDSIINFETKGGFAMGILFSILLLPVIHQSKRHRITFWILRAISLPLIILAFALLLKNFETDDPASGCGWCRYLSCWPTNNNSESFRVFFVRMGWLMVDGGGI